MSTGGSVKVNILEKRHLEFDVQIYTTYTKICEFVLIFSLSLFVYICVL